MLVLVISGFSFLVALILTPLCRNFFTRAGLVDRPDGGRRQHRQPIPRLGGIPIVISWGCAVLLLNCFVIAPFATLNWGLIPALAMIFGTGLADDIWGLKPLEKLFGQISAAAMAYAGGVQIHGFAGSSAPWLSFAVTLLWLIGCTNAFNLIDGVRRARLRRGPFCHHHHPASRTPATQYAFGLRHGAARWCIDRISAIQL